MYSFAARHDQFVLGVEQCCGDVVEVTSARVHLPRLRFTHSPYLDLAIIRGRDNERERRVESGPVDATVVTLKDILDCREVVERVECAWC